MATSAIKITYDEGSAPATPAANKVVTYAKSDGLIYSKDDAGVEKLMSVGSGTGTPLNPGSSFPGSPSTGDLCFRTDRGLLYYYDGTRWLTTTLYRDGESVLNAGTTTSGVATSRAGSVWDTTELYLVDLYASLHVATTNTGAAYWTLNLRKYQNDLATSVVAAFVNTSANAPNVTVKSRTAINALLTIATYNWLQFEAVKTGSPGALHLEHSYSYRLVG